MANEENPTPYIQKRKPLNIGGLYSAAHNHHGEQLQKSKEERMEQVAKSLEELKSSGLITQIGLGAKHCFFVNKIDFDSTSKLKGLLDLSNDDSAVSNGWIAVSTISDDGSTPSLPLKDAIAFYRSIPGDDNCLTVYGETTLGVDFSKIEMARDEEGNVKYPYGIFFFSDVTTPANKYAATVSCCQSRIQAASRNKFYTPILDWTKTSVTGNFRGHGTFVVFYVDSEIEKAEGAKWPVITTIEIDTGVSRETDAIAKNYIYRVGKTSRCVENDVEFIINNVYGRYASSIDTKSKFDSHFIGDYIYYIGDDPSYYNLVPSRDSFKPKSFATTNSIETATKEGSKIDNSGKGKKPFKKNGKKFPKKGNTPETPTETTTTSEPSNPVLSETVTTGDPVAPVASTGDPVTPVATTSTSDEDTITSQTNQ